MRNLNFSLLKASKLEPKVPAPTLHKEEPIVNIDILELEQHAGHLVAVESLNVEKRNSLHVGMESVQLENRLCSQGDAPDATEPHTLIIQDGVVYAYITGQCSSTIPYLTHLLIQAEENDRFVISLNQNSLNEAYLLEVASAIELSKAEVLVRAVSTDRTDCFFSILVADKIELFDGMFVFSQLKDFTYGTTSDVMASAEASMRYSDYIWSTLMKAKVVTQDDVNNVIKKAKTIGIAGSELMKRIAQPAPEQV